MNITIFKYGLIFCLLLGILESNGIPVITNFSVAANQSKNDNGNCAEDPIKEAELIKAESVKDYLHQICAVYFSEPVFNIKVQYNLSPQVELRTSFYPDVLTPPPNC